MDTCVYPLDLSIWDIDNDSDNEDDLFYTPTLRLSRPKNPVYSTVSAPVLSSPIPFQFGARAVEDPVEKPSKPHTLVESPFGQSLEDIEMLQLTVVGMFGKSIALSIPAVFERIHKTWKLHPEVLDTDDVFIVDAPTKLLNAAITCIVKGKQKHVDFSILSTIILKFISEIPGGIFTQEMEPVFLDIAKETSRSRDLFLRRFLLCCHRIPRRNQDLLFWLLILLKDVIRSSSNNIDGGMLSVKLENVLFPQHRADENANKRLFCRILLSATSEY